MNETIENLKTRRSIRKFKDEQISDEELKTILEAGTYAPTGRGLQSPKIVVIQNSETIKELSLKGAKVVIIAHQSRPGKNDFTKLDQHAVELSRCVGLEVKYVDSLFSSRAKEAILALEPGQILLLENARFFSEETLKRSPEEQATSVLVRELSPVADYFVNDAFAAAHRSQASLVGFTRTLPSAAGRVMENELKTISNALDNVQHPCVFALGGMKADDSIMVMENVLANGTADYVLVSGLIANIVIWAILAWYCCFHK